MLFFGFHMLLGRAPEKNVFARYILSRRLMGIALLMLSTMLSIFSAISGSAMSMPLFWWISPHISSAAGFSLGIHHSVYGKNFRCWIADLRIEYAKRLMKQHPNMRVQDVSASSGFISLSHFTRTFGMKEDFSPSKWHGPLQRLAERIACEQISADPDAGNGPPAQGVARPWSAAFYGLHTMVRNLQPHAEERHDVRIERVGPTVHVWGWIAPVFPSRPHLGSDKTWRKRGRPRTISVHDLPPFFVVLCCLKGMCVQNTVCVVKHRK